MTDIDSSACVPRSTPRGWIRLTSTASLLLGAASMVVACGAEGEGDETATPAAVVVEQVIQGGEATAARDAVPGPGAAVMYFIAQGADGPGLFSVPASGGEATEVTGSFDAEPSDPDSDGVLSHFVEPRGVAVSPDGERVFVADPEAAGGQGAIVSVDAESGEAAIVPGTLGTRASSLDVKAGSADVEITFTGELNGLPAILKLPLGSGVQVLSQDASFVRPDGVAVADDGTVFIADPEAGDEGHGRVFRLRDGSLDVAVPEVKTGDPAGVALTLDGQTLLVSAIDREAGTDQVVLVNTTTFAASIFDNVIGANTAGGGVHRSPDRDTFGWADSTCSVRGHGCVYRIDF